MRSENVFLNNISYQPYENRTEMEEIYIIFVLRPNPQGTLFPIIRLMIRSVIGKRKPTLCQTTKVRVHVGEGANFEAGFVAFLKSNNRKNPPLTGSKRRSPYRGRSYDAQCCFLKKQHQKNRPCLHKGRNPYRGRSEFRSGIRCFSKKQQSKKSAPY